MKEADVTTQFKNELLEWCQQSGIGVFWHKIEDFPVQLLMAAEAEPKKRAIQTWPKIKQIITGLTCEIGPVVDAQISRVRGMVFDIPGGPKFRFAQRKKPFDVVATIGGIPIAIEWKLQKKDGAIPCNLLQENQVDALKRFHNAGGVALAAIATIFEVNPDRVHEYPAVGIYRGNLYRIFFVPINVWLIAQTYASDRGRKSVTQEQLREMLGVVEVCRVDREKGRGWDVGKFWNHCYWLDTDDGRFEVERALDGAMEF